MIKGASDVATEVDDAVESTLVTLLDCMTSKIGTAFSSAFAYDCPQTYLSAKTEHSLKASC